MKDELKSYLKELTSNNDTNEPSTIDNYSEQSYSNYQIKRYKNYKTTKYDSNNSKIVTHNFCIIIYIKPH